MIMPFQKMPFLSIIRSRLCKAAEAKHRFGHNEQTPDDVDRRHLGCENPRSHLCFECNLKITFET